MANIRRKPVIVLDAGHNGKDSGIIARYSKIYEKNITLAFTKQLAYKHKKQENMKFI